MPYALLVLLSGALGASTLAVILLYRAHRRDRVRITKLSSELAVQKLTALALGVPASGRPDQDDEPVHRKRHLSLYLGSGLAAFLAFFGQRGRHATHNYRAAATITAAATAMAVATGMVLTASNSALPLPAAPPVAGPRLPGKVTEDYRTYPDNEGASFNTTKEGDGSDVTPSTNLNARRLGRPNDMVALAQPRPSAVASTPAPGDEQKEERPDAEPAPTPPIPTPAPPTPTVPAPTPEQEPDDEGVACVNLPPLVDLCLL